MSHESSYEVRNSPEGPPVRSGSLSRALVNGQPTSAGAEVVGPRPAAHDKIAFLEAQQNQLLALVRNEIRSAWALGLLGAGR
jgi:hypothetical protein